MRLRSSFFRLGGSTPVRAVSRDTDGKPAAVAGRSAAPLVADQGVAVETGSRISAGPVPVDNDRVATIREALREGRYPIVPAQISDALIAARLMLATN